MGRTRWILAFIPVLLAAAPAARNEPRGKPPEALTLSGFAG